MTEPMRAAPPAAWWKTSVRLTAATRARYEASGRSLSALIERGLDVCEAEAAGADPGVCLDPLKAVMIDVERALRASMNEHGMIVWPGLPESIPAGLLPQPRTGPVRLRRVGRQPTRRYQPRENQA